MTVVSTLPPPFLRNQFQMASDTMACSTKQQAGAKHGKQRVDAELSLGSRIVETMNTAKQNDPDRSQDRLHERSLVRALVVVMRFSNSLRQHTFTRQ